MEALEVRSTKGVLEQLVHQFADPMAFLRELVQNSIDAGTELIEVRCELRPTGPASADGVMILSVADWGEGMDRYIIDQRLTRLFSSDKTNDRTKIGKFGIGFVSVFALEPDAVCVDTGRAGERWRVLFRPDRSFTRIALDEPIEGTRVSVIKTVRCDEYPELVQRAAAVLSYWCRHIEVELRFQGERINRPFSVDGLCEVRADGPLGTIVVGIPREGQPAYGGYYNRGLTLLEIPAAQSATFASITYKISSPRLSHTLSRDDVVKDEVHGQLMAQVHSLCGEPLSAAVLDRLAAALERGAPPGEWAPLQRYALGQLAARSLPRKADSRYMARTVDGAPVALSVLRQHAERSKLLLSAVPSPLSQVLAQAGWLVLKAEAHTRELCEHLLGRSVETAGERFGLPVQATDPALCERGAPLRAAVAALLLARGLAVRAVALGHMDYPGSNLAGWAAVAQAEAFALIPLADARRSDGKARQDLVLNVDHPAVQELMTLARAEPEWAAYTLLKLHFLNIGLTCELDSALGTLAVEARWRRLKS